VPGGLSRRLANLLSRSTLQIYPSRVLVSRLSAHRPSPASVEFDIVKYNNRSCHHCRCASNWVVTPHAQVP
jgi:hypothetical protein